jgi:hypothetical protein
MATIEAFCSKFGLTSRGGIAAKEIAAFETEFGLTFPAEVRQLYRFSDGLDVPAAHFEFMSLSEMRRYPPMFLSGRWQWLPLTDSNDSNPYCVSCALRGRIMRVHHDDVAVVRCRGFESFLDAVLARHAELEVLGEDADDEASLVDSLRCDYDEFTVRTAEDIADGLALLLGEEDEDDVTCNEAYRFGMALVSDTEAATVAALLGHADSYVREAARDRLQQMMGPAAKEAVSQYKAAFAAFVRSCAKTLRAAGFTVAKAAKGTITLEPGPVHLNMDRFYSSRDRDDFAEFFVAAVRALVAKKPRRS